MTAKEISRIIGCYNESIPALALRQRWRRKKIKGRNEYDYDVTPEQLDGVPKPKRGRPFKDKFKNA